MTRRNVILSVLLALQLLLVVVLWWPRGSTASAGKLFADLDPNSVSSLSVADDTRTVRLEKVDGKWVLPAADNYPVNELRVSDLLTKLVQIDTRRLVASNSASHNRLQVSDDTFVRKVDLTTNDGDTLTLLVGSAPNARATHVRSADSDAVYQTGALSTADVRSDVGNWIDTVYLQNANDAVRGLAVENVSGVLRFDQGVDGSWEIVGLADGETTNQESVKSLVNQLNTLNMIEPLGKEIKAEYGLEQPAAMITLTVQPTTTTTAQTITLAVGTKAIEDNSYPVKSSTSEYVVKVAGFTLDGFVNKQRGDFVTLPEPAAVAPITATAPISIGAVLTGVIPITSTAPLTDSQP
jgi:hypothetical protein